MELNSEHSIKNIFLLSYHNKLDELQKKKEEVEEEKGMQLVGEVDGKFASLLKIFVFL